MSKPFSPLKALTLAAMLSLAGTTGALAMSGGCASGQLRDAHASTHAAVTSMTVVDLAMMSPDHTNLVAAVAQAGLVEALSGEGPFTIFAPGNAAFEAVDADTLAFLFTEEGQPTLTAILTTHVVSGNIMAADVLAAIENGPVELSTLAGNTLTLALNDGAVQITDPQGRTATITAVDLSADNGVIHVIDTVLLP